jgi:hypothetical protein
MADHDLPLVLFLDDLARALRTSRRTLENLRRHGALKQLLPELPSIDKRPRWSRDAVLRFLDGQRMTKTTLRRVG